MEEKIKANAELVIAQMRPLSGFDFGYDAESVAWLDGYIERQRARADRSLEREAGLVNVFGSYLGECIIRCHGGQWEQQDGAWRVIFDDRIAADPFAKVQKHFEFGAEHSIQSFYEAIPALFARAISPGKANPKPWWKIW